jgi:hypothetical protein
VIAELTNPVQRVTSDVILESISPVQRATETGEVSAAKDMER